MEQWKEYKLGDTSLQIIDGDRGKNYPKGNDFSTTGYCIFLNAGNVTKDGWNFSDVIYITKEKDDALRNGKLQRGDLVLTTRGTIGNVAFYSDNIPYDNIRINSGMVIIRNNGEYHTPYLYHFFRSNLFFAQILLFQSGSAQPQIPISTIDKLSIFIPPFATQKRIADILSSLDNKIEINKQINDNLLAA